MVVRPNQTEKIKTKGGINDPMNQKVYGEVVSIGTATYSHKVEKEYQ